MSRVPDLGCVLETAGRSDAGRLAPHVMIAVATEELPLVVSRAPGLGCVLETGGRSDAGRLAPHVMIALAAEELPFAVFVFRT